MSRIGRASRRGVNPDVPTKSRLSPVFHPQQHHNELHSQIVKQARQSGVLNLTNRGYITVPSQVWNINSLTEKEVKTLSVSMDNTDDRWWDQVDLTKLNLANNLITEISNEISLLNCLQVLDLHDNKLTDLPEGFSELVHLTKLDISHNNFPKVPACVFCLKELRFLQAKNNEIKSFEGDLGDLNMLENLDLSSNQLTILPGGIGFLSKLLHLDLSQNKIQEIPEEIGNLTALRILDLSNNLLTNLPHGAGDIFRLEQLYLRHNRLTQLPILHKCDSLKELYCGSNNITEIPVECLEPIINVKVLELRDNKITSLPDDITVLQFLERLDMTNNHLTSLPFALGIMPHLITLSLDGNPLKAIRRDIIQRGTTFLLKHLRSRLEESNPDGLTFRRSPNRPCSGEGIKSFQEAINIDPITFRQTKTFDISNRQVLEVPQDLIQMAGECKVTVVNFSKNLLTEVSPSLETTFPHLLELNLSFNLLASLPSFVGNASRLTFLDLHANQLQTLPEEISNLKNLREIFITIISLIVINHCKSLLQSNNKFTEIPSPVYSLEKVEIIIANDNKIQNINVEGLSKLKLLAVLDLRNNDISMVPPELGNLTQLRSLQLEGNLFRQPRLTILNRGTEYLLQYLRDRIPA